MRYITTLLASSLVLASLAYASPPLKEPATQPVNAPTSRPATRGWQIEGDAAQLGNAKVEVVLAGVGTAALTDASGEPRKMAEKYFLVKVTITNTSPNKRVFYSTWRGLIIDVGHDFASLVDDNDNPYKRVQPPLGSKITSGVDEGASINPGESVTDLILFERPIDVAKSVTLRLPGGNLKAAGGAVFVLVRPAKPEN